MRRAIPLSIALCAALCGLPSAAAARGDDCRRSLVAASSAAPLATGRCTGVRPGAFAETPLGFCTLNFAFRGRRGARFIGTAGHCVLPETVSAERRWRRGRGPVLRNLDGEAIGRFAYAALELDGDRDFALVRLRKGVRPEPAICHFGGPTGINRDISSRTQSLNLYGNGVLAGELLPARQIVALGLPDPDHVFATGVATPGDSGGPVTSRDGRAVGVLVSGGVHLGSVGTDGVDAGDLGVTRIGPQIDRAKRILRERLKLLTAPRR